MDWEHKRDGVKLPGTLLKGKPVHGRIERQSPLEGADPTSENWRMWKWQKFKTFLGVEGSE